MKMPKSFLTPIIVLTGAIIVGALLLYSSPSIAVPKIEWTPASVEIAVSQGQRQPVPVDVTASEDVTGEVTVRVVPELEPYVSVSPTSFAGLTAGQKQTVEITATTESDSPLGTFDGTIQLRSGNKNLAKPLPVVLTVLEAAPLPFVPTGSMPAPRFAHTATLLKNGKVLIAGGSRERNTDQLASALIYDPETEVFTPTGSMNLPRWGHSAVRLDDDIGRVLIIGGWTNSFVTATETAEIYNPQTGEFTFTGNMSTPRGDYPSLIKLPDGRIYVLGGTFEGNFGEATGNVDRYDPNTGTFEQVGTLALERRNNAATLLQDGTILLAGGSFRCCNDPGNPARYFSAEIYDPATNTARLTDGEMSFQRSRFAKAVTLDNNRALIVGPDTAPLEIYEVDTSGFRPVGDSVTLARASATMLPDGRVLIVDLGIHPDALIFDPDTEEVTPVGPVVDGRAAHTATVLNNGRVLLVGGVGANSSRLSSAELFVPYP